MGDGWVAKRMNAMELVVETTADPLSFVAPIRHEIQVIDRGQPLRQRADHGELAG